MEPAVAARYRPPEVTKVAAGIHDGHLFGPLLRSDGEWVAYGLVLEEERTKLRYYRRSLAGDGLFKSVWPRQHPTFSEKEGTASFTDLTGFAWHPGSRHNAMVVRHKSKGEEVLLEYLKVRVGGPGEQNQPTFNPDGSRVVVVALGELGRELWVSDVKHSSDLEQLTWTRDSERWPSWHPTAPKVLHEIRVRKTKRSDLFAFDLETYEQVPVLRIEASDEIHPSFSPDGERIVYLSDHNREAGASPRVYDLFARTPGATEAVRLIPSVRVREQSLGYAWDPAGHFVVAVSQDERRGHPLVIARADGRGKVLNLGLATRNNWDPVLSVTEDRVRLVWAADDPKAREGREYQILYFADFSLATLYGLLGVEAAK